MNMVVSVEEAWSAIRGKHRTIRLRALSSKAFATSGGNVPLYRCCIGNSRATRAVAIHANQQFVNLRRGQEQGRERPIRVLGLSSNHGLAMH
ncbi:hypothetical protein [Hydrocarboniphaga effusa]|uniref:hypothetical protein n=1 Tax=Hydrocarboniphaga effusa TaxID=243629 RepID=UPI00398BBD5B